jgi:hypothetical protein
MALEGIRVVKRSPLYPTNNPQVKSRLQGSCVQSLEPRRLCSTYYVSPTGDDSRTGLDSAHAWRTVAKVNAIAFQPGDQILFQRGGVWHEALSASSSGTASQPITYADYGSTSQPNPLFMGSDPLDTSGFAPLAGSSSTYTLSTSTAINWVYDNHNFLREAPDVTATNDPTTNINWVNSTIGSWYLNGGTLYVNVGGPLAGHTLTAAVRDDEVSAFSKSNLVFDNLDVTETAKDAAGYGFRMQFDSNITIENCNATLCGKHHFGVIDTTGFLGQNLTAQQAPPDLGFGGASAYVSFSDNNGGRQGDTSRWINCSWSNPNGPYAVFITHGDPGAIGSVYLQNLTSSGWGTGILCYGTGPAEQITIVGGQMDQGVIEIDADNAVVDGVHLTNTSASVTLNGANDIARNCVFDNIQPYPYAGVNGGIVVNGTNDTITGNVFRFDNSPGPAINIMNANTNTTIHGNVFDCPTPIWQLFNGTSTIDCDRNVYRTGISMESGDIQHTNAVSWSQWQALGRDLNSLTIPQGGFSYGSLQLGGPSAGMSTLGIVPQGPGNVLVAQTPLGDTNLDGRVNVSDLANFAGNFGRTVAGIGWLNGDFDYDGRVTVSDLADIAAAFGQQSSVATAVTATADVGSARSSPNPPAPLDIATGNVRSQSSDDRAFSNIDALFHDLPTIE